MNGIAVAETVTVAVAVADARGGGTRWRGGVESIYAGTGERPARKVDRGREGKDQDAVAAKKGEVVSRYGRSGSRADRWPLEREGVFVGCM